LEYLTNLEIAIIMERDSDKPPKTNDYTDKDLGGEIGEKFPWFSTLIEAFGGLIKRTVGFDCSQEDLEEEEISDPQEAKRRERQLQIWLEKSFSRFGCGSRILEG